LELNQDERGRQYLKANFGIDDIRLMYDALNHLYDNWPGGSPRDRREHERLEKMKSMFYSMLMEYTLHQR
tara:strand:- start:567 stop:776 length:210 start_codon:yes stop_codon:yes gene_type:complete